MAFTRILGPGIHTASNINSHNIKSTGIITAVSFVGDGSSLTGIANTDFIVGTAITMGTANFTGALTGTTANFSGNVTVGGVLTYEDVKNVDSIGIITARSGVDVDDFLDVGSNIKLGNAGVITATTFKGDGDFVDLDVDGTTSLDHTDIVGFVTVTSNSSSDGRIRIQGAQQGLKIHLHRASTSSVSIRYQNNFGSLYAGLGDGFNNDQRFVIGKNGTLSNDPILQASERYNVIVGTGITLSGSNGNATFAGIITATAFKLADGSAIGAGAGGTWSSYTAGIATSKSVGVNTTNLDDTDLTGIGNSFKGLYISNGMIVHDNVLNGNHYIGTSMNGLMAGPVTIDGNLEIDGNYVVV